MGVNMTTPLVAKELQAYCLVNGKLIKTPIDVDKGDIVEKLPPHLSLAISLELEKQDIKSRIEVLQEWSDELWQNEDTVNKAKAIDSRIISLSQSPEDKPWVGGER